MKTLYINTPLLESKPISKATGKQLFLKMEALQPTGSFKIRGISNLCEKLAKDGAKRFVTTSAGNAGLALIYAGNELNIPVTVVVWNHISEAIRNNLRQEGADIIEHGSDWMEANTFAESICKENEVCFVHPFDHPLLWGGHASLIHEVKASGLRPDAIVVAVGGGGLLSGIVQGLHEVGWSDIPVFTAETRGTASFAESIKAGKLVALEKIESLAVSLGARQVAEQAFLWAQKHQIIPCVVSDAQAVSAVFQFLKDHRVLVEPACGAALALAYNQHPKLMSYEKILIIVCGGCGISCDDLEKWKQDFNL